MRNSAPLEPVYRVVGARINLLRKKRGIGRPDFAKRVGLSTSTLWDIEHGRSRVMPHMLQKIAKELRTTPDDLLKGVWK